MGSGIKRSQKTPLHIHRQQLTEYGVARCYVRLSALRLVWALVVLSRVLLVVGYWPKQMAPPPTESQDFLDSTDLRESLRGNY
jgi:hypothetical protein